MRAIERKRSTARGRGSRKAYPARQRNALYRLAGEFKRRHPKATAAEAWRHLCAVAGTGAHDVVLAHDPAADALEYLPNTERRGTRTVTRRAFEQGYYRINNISP